MDEKLLIIIGGALTALLSLFGYVIKQLLKSMDKKDNAILQQGKDSSALLEKNTQGFTEMKGAMDNLTNAMVIITRRKK